MLRFQLDHRLSIRYVAYRREGKCEKPSEVWILNLSFAFEVMTCRFRVLAIDLSCRL